MLKTEQEEMHSHLLLTIQDISALISSSNMQTLLLCIFFPFWVSISSIVLSTSLFFSTENVRFLFDIHIILKGYVVLVGVFHFISEK